MLQCITEILVNWWYVALNTLVLHWIVFISVTVVSDHHCT